VCASCGALEEYAEADTIWVEGVPRGYFLVELCGAGGKRFREGEVVTLVGVAFGRGICRVSDSTRHRIRGDHKLYGKEVEA
jgi:hypothetical protein